MKLRPVFICLSATLLILASLFFAALLFRNRSHEQRQAIDGLNQVSQCHGHECLPFISYDPYSRGPELS